MHTSRTAVRGRGFLAGALFGLLLLLAGCAGTFQPMGPMVQLPDLTVDAVVTADGTRLPPRSWLPEKDVPVRAVVLALHGFNDYSNAFDGPGRTFAAHGIATYAYDQRGFGAGVQPGIWATADTMITDLHVAAALVQLRYPGVPFYLLGES